MHHREFHRDLRALTLSIHVHAPGINRVSFFCPCNQLLDRLVIVRSEFPALWRRSDEHVLIEESLTQQRLAHREQVVAGWSIVLLRAEDQTDLLRGIRRAGGGDARRNLNHILEDGLSAFILEFAFGGAQRCEQQSGREQQTGKPAEYCKRSRLHPGGPPNFRQVYINESAFAD